MKKEIKKCDFCKKPLAKEDYRVKDKFRSYIICDKCNSKVIKFELEYNTEAQKLDKEHRNKLEQLASRLRKKYNLKKH